MLLNLTCCLTGQAGSDAFNHMLLISLTELVPLKITSVIRREVNCKDCSEV